MGPERDGSRGVKRSPFSYQLPDLEKTISFAAAAGRTLTLRDLDHKLPILFFLYGDSLGIYIHIIASFKLYLHLHFLKINCLIACSTIV